MVGLLYRISDRLRQRARGSFLPVEALHGKLGEDYAHRLLRREGFTVVARNYRLPAGGGEIDIIAWEGPRLAFVEVKTRVNQDFGPPDAAVGDEKREFLRRAARDYARRAGVAWELVRFDLVNVVLEPPSLELFRDAFTGLRTL
jgi:putative endonuclease